VGPENGLFEMILRRARAEPRCWHITWRPERLSASFHGRDLFAPVAARLARDETPLGREYPLTEMFRPDWSDELAEIVYVDGFGNAIAGVRAETLPLNAEIFISKRRLQRATTFSDVLPGEAFWYENSNGLVEVAVNLGRADMVLGIGLGSPIYISKGEVASAKTVVTG
jgi:hypothetical protein